jgi:hypothetical protein
MSRRPFLFFLALAVASVMTIPVWAKANAKASLSTTITFDSAIKLANQTLAPGKYRVVAQANNAKFELNGKTVADVPCTMKTLPNKSQHTELFTNGNNRLTQIEVSGKTEALEFGS